MPLKQLLNGKIDRFWVGLTILWLVSLGLRFWGLSRFNTLVFDEVYFARFGNNYLSGTPFFDAHPPLGKYLIGLGIWLHGGFDPFGYRWLNALVGSFLPLVIAGLAYQLSQRRSYALIAGLLTATDGLLLVESRYALINIFLLFFGFLGQWLFLIALGRSDWKRYLWLGCAALCLGAAVAVKWNGLGFLLGIYLTWGVSLLLFWSFPKHRPLGQPGSGLPLLQLPRLNPLVMLLGIPAIAALVYGLAWIPHLHQNPTAGFWALQQQMLDYHKAIGNSSQVHPYCSPWSSWPLLIRPLNYFYQRGINLSEPMPVLGPPLPLSSTEVIYSVLAMGNPFLWWGATLAILGLSCWLFWVLGRGSEGKTPLFSPSSHGSGMFWLVLYLVVSYDANLLPWARVSRCLFLYHYLPASIFSFLGLAWICDLALRSPRLWQRSLGITMIFLCLGSLVYWLPVYLGLPLSPEGFSQRIWLKSWI
jgi:dolichyl-phosphate-mannose-protein mannosyltransferase